MATGFGVGAAVERRRERRGDGQARLRLAQGPVPGRRDVVAGDSRGALARTGAQGPDVQPCGDVERSRRRIVVRRRETDRADAVADPRNAVADPRNAVRLRRSRMRETARNAVRRPLHPSVPVVDDRPVKGRQIIFDHRRSAGHGVRKAAFRSRAGRAAARVDVER